MGTTSLEDLTQRLSESIGDYIDEVVTTNIGADRLIVSTHLNKWDYGTNGYFKGKWAYVHSQNNDGQDRRIRLYYTGNATCNVYGAVFTADTNIADVRIHRYPYTSQRKAVNDSIRDLRGVLFKRVDDQTVITGQRLPDGHFENWVNANAMTFMNTTNADIRRQVDNEVLWGGTYGMRLTPTQANGVSAFTSNSFPRLRDLGGHTLDFKAKVYPATTNSAFLEIYTVNSIGTQQTLRSTTASLERRWTLLELEDQSINGDLTHFEARFGGVLNGLALYFDNARLVGRDTLEYVLPPDLQDGELRQVYLQATGEDCDELHPNRWNEIIGWSITEDGSYKYLHMPYFFTKERKIRLVGTTPLEEMTDFSDTIDLDGDRINLLMARSAYRLFLREEGVPSSEDKRTYNSRANDWLGEYYRLLPGLRMTKPATKQILLSP